MALQPHAVMSAKGRLILCTVLGSTPKRLAMPRTPSPVRLRLAQGGRDALLQLGRYSEAAPIVSPHPWPAQAPRASYSGQD
jgi:hypothetical protein